MNTQISVPTKIKQLGSLLAIAFLLAAPISASARYIDFGMSYSSNFFCGLFENGTTECMTVDVRDLSDISSDPNTVFTDIEVGNLYACGITTSGSVSCWGSAAEEALNAPLFDAEVVKIRAYSYGACALDAASNVKCWGDLPTGITDSDNLTSIINSQDVLNCNINLDGNAACTDTAGTQVAAFNNGPYEQIFVSGDFDNKFACAVTQFGELDCTAGIYTNVEPTSTMLTVNREAGSYSIVRPTPVSMCGFTVDNKLKCIDRTNYQERNRQLLLATVNGELDLPTVELLNAQVYDFGVELFFEKTTTSSYSVNILSHTEIFRDDVYLATTENGRSYIDRTAESNNEYTYTARTTHPYGQAGEFINVLKVNTSPSSSNENNSLETQHINGTKGLYADIYWYDIELFWDRNESGAVRHYEIRKNGKFIAASRGTSWYDDTTESGALYVYDVIAIGHDDEILGFESAHVHIGATECS